MKYCKNCGMLLEDSNEICIGCGTDVMDPENVSDYPIEMAEEIEKEKDESNERHKMIMIIVGVFAAIIALVILLIFRISQDESIVSNLEAEVTEVTEEMEETEEISDDMEEETLEEDVEEPEEANIDADGEVMVSPDDAADGMDIEEDGDLVNMSEQHPEGRVSDQPEENTDEESETETPEPASNIVLKETTQEDVAGNVIFTTKYPEEFTKPSGSILRSIPSSRFREQVNFNVSNPEQTAVFTYVSPQQFWFRDSNSGQSRSNETDDVNYMTYFAYNDGIETYLESRIKTGNSSLKNLKLVSKESYSPTIDSKVSNFSKDFTTESNTGSLGDYGCIGSDTEYVALEGGMGAYIYKYEATIGSTTVYMDFYAPYVANRFNYSSEASNDMGELTEWILIELIGFQAGNKEIYDKYHGAFETFIKESKISREMLYDEYKYYEEIKAARTNGGFPDELTKEKLNSYHSSYSDSESIGTFYQNLYDMIGSK